MEEEFPERNDCHDIVYHLHPNLVDVDVNGQCYTYLCPTCKHSIFDLKQVPELSVANGQDFGSYRRLGLEEPNLHEQIILAKTRLYQVSVKIRSNAFGQADATTKSIGKKH